MIFSHSGDFGDVIYALPVIQYLGGGDVRLFPSKHTGYRMTAERVAAMRPLLELQSYITSCEWSSGPSGLNLDGWRQAKYYDGLNLSDNVCKHFCVPFSDQNKPWMVIDEINPVAEVVFAVGTRWRGKVNWRPSVEVYRGRSVFLGLPDEHAVFERDYGQIPYFPTSTLLDAARVLAGAKLIHCSQSSLRSIAEALKLPVVVEQCPSCANTHFERPGAQYI